MTQPLTKDTLSLNQIVYYHSYDNNIVLKAKIVEIYDKLAVKVENLANISKNGTISVHSFLSEKDIYIQNLYSSPQEAWKAYEERQEEEIRAYCEAIETIVDLVNFPLHHCIAEDDENCDHNARKAYMIRVGELIFKGKDRIEEYSSIQALSR